MLSAIPPLDYKQELRFVQAYLQLNPEVRVRSDGARHWMMEKTGSGLVRDEFTRELNAEEFYRLLNRAQWRIDKVRRIACEGNHVFEMDEFLGALSGLHIVEVEFASTEEADAFVPPAWFGREVTHDERFKCVSLATNGLPAGISPRRLSYKENGSLGTKDAK